MILFSRTALVDPQVQLSAQRLSTRFGFFGLGFVTAAWAPLIPFAQQRLNFNHGDFGLLLLCGGLGAIIAMFASGRMVQRIGCRAPIGMALIALSLLLPGLTLWHSAAMMAVSLFFFGAASGSLGVALNIQAVIVEKNSLKSLMSSFHGMGSLGGLAGVLTVTALLALNVSPIISALTIGVMVLAMSIVAAPFGLKEIESTEVPEKNDKPKTFSERLPSPVIILIGIASFIVFMNEGAAADWSGIYLTHHYGLNATFAGLAYTFFAIAMTAGRFSGHYFIRRFGETRLLTYGAFCAALGLTLVSIAPYWIMVLAGYTLVGFGCSNIVPIMFSRAGRQTFMSKTAALACVSTLAYTGILVGPAFIGMVGELIGLNHVFMILSIMLLTIVALNRLTVIK